MVTRCKFHCTSVTKQKHWDKRDTFLYSAEFQVVYNDSPENAIFFDATPIGSLKLGSYKQDAFEPGKEYFIDIAVAERLAA